MVAFFALGLMAKPMLVTLPLVLLLLDYWPLGRWNAAAAAQALPQASPRRGSPGPARLVIEKLPLLALSAASCVVTSFAQRSAVETIEHVPVAFRIANALTACAAYMGKLFFPAGLSVFYPHPKADISPAKVVLAVLLLASISVASVAWRRSRPYLLVGWLWYLGMLVPVIGLVQVGGQSMADRYTYLPQIGLVIALTWSAKEVLKAWSLRAWMYGAAAGLVVAALMASAADQASNWRDNETLWSHALLCDPNNAVAHLNLGVTVEKAGRVAEAVGHYRKVIEIDPTFAEAYNDLGGVLLQEGRAEEAAAEYQKALQIDPEYANAHSNYGVVLLRLDYVAEAVAHFHKALEIDPHLVPAHYNLGNALAGQGELDEAVAEYRKALECQRNYAQAHHKLGLALYQRGEIEEAMTQWAAAIRLQPENALFVDDLAWALATCREASARNGAKAVTLAEGAVKITAGKDPRALDVLAAAYAEAGRFPEAVETAQRALALPQRREKAADTDTLRARLKLYQSGFPYHPSVQGGRPNSGQS